MPTMVGPSLPDRVSQWYYTYGLFCSSHPRPAIVFSLTCVLLCCYPLLNIPLPGNIPTRVIIPNHNNFSQIYNSSQHMKTSMNNSNNVIKLRQRNGEEDLIYVKHEKPVSLVELMNESRNIPHLWSKDDPLVYVQQIVIKSGVLPWTESLLLADAFRAPLQEAFHLIEIIRNFEHSETGLTLSQLCTHVENVKRTSQSTAMPEYNCLLLSPANLWQQNLHHFKVDTNILSTIYNYQNFQKGKVSVADVLFGMKLKDTGFKRYPFRTRPRVVQYAITLFFNKLDEKYISSLQEKLLSTYPLHGESNDGLFEVALIHYPGEFKYEAFVPLSLSFVVLFFYVYFSVKKIELVKSKCGLAMCAVLTVAGSLSMSIGICFFFGLTFNIQGREIFPYLVILVGLENVLVLTKSVMSTDSVLDVKIRLAQGLSKEGWSITKNLLTEITILTFGLFTFVPVIQEFSMFMIVSLLSDFFLQMIFFATVLGMDVRQMEMCRNKCSDFQLKDFFSSSFRANKNDYVTMQSFSNRIFADDTGITPKKISRSKSHPKLNGLFQSPTDVVGGHYQNCNQGSPGKAERKVPKRIMLFNIWARTRFFQRAIMILVIVWISMISYNSGFIKDIFEMKGLDENVNTKQQNLSKIHLSDINSTGEIKQISKKYNEQSNDDIKWSTSNRFVTESYQATRNNLSDYISLNRTEYPSALKHFQYFQPWKRLSNYHWSSILSQYNVSVSGRYITILPPILLSCRISPENAVLARNPEEKGPKPVQWHPLAAALDPLDLSDLEIDSWHLGSQQNYWNKITSSNDLPYYPTTPMEVLLLTILCGISVLVIAYTMVVIYRCVCSRNYAEWRASWTDEKSLQNKKLPRHSVQFVMEAVPIVVPGHVNEVECIVSDGDRIISSCLQGQLKVWNSQNGELLTNIDRKVFFGLGDHSVEQNEENCEGNLPFSKMHKDCNMVQNAAIHEYEIFKDSVNKEKLKSHISSALENIKSESHDQLLKSHINSKSILENTSYDFARQYRQLYVNGNQPHKDLVKNKFQSSDCDKTEHRETCLLCERNIDNCQHKDVISAAKANRPKEYIVSLSTKFENSSKENIDPSELQINTIENKNTKCIEQSDCVTLSSKTDNCVRNRSTGEVLNIPISNNTSFSAVNSPPELFLHNTFTPPKFVPMETSNQTASPIWSMDFAENLIVVGCANGRIEFWEATTGKLKCLLEEEGRDTGVTHLRMCGGAARVFAARLGGHLDALRVHVYNAGRGTSVDWSFTAAYKRTHTRTGSAGSIPAASIGSWKFGSNLEYDSTVDDSCASSDNVRCVRIAVARAHQQPISVLETGGGRVITGSHDHTLKVFSCGDLSPLYTLHGHCGPITSCFIDRLQPVIGGSGSQDGLLCVWDLHTGACLYSVQAHDGAVTSLAYSASYVMSAGIDERLCIFDRFQGHLLNTLYIGMSYTCNILPLTHSLLLVGGKNSLTVWDVSYGQNVRKVVLGQNDGFVFVKQILPLKDAIVCDYANQLRIVRFPLISKMFERGLKTD